MSVCPVTFVGDLDEHTASHQQGTRMVPERLATPSPPVTAMAECDACPVLTAKPEWGKASIGTTDG